MRPMRPMRPPHAQGETEPSPYFIQNLGEAEYIVAIYSFMRLMGYPAHKISILTTCVACLMLDQ